MRTPTVTAPAHARPAGPRRITANTYRAAAAWTAATCFDGWAWADRVTAVVAALIEDPRGVVDGDDLAAALREPATVDVALDLLARAGACPEPAA